MCFRSGATQFPPQNTMLQGKGPTRNADSRRSHRRRRNRRRKHRVASDRRRLPQRAHRRAGVAPGQRIDGQEHGRRARAVRHQAQHPDVAVLHSFLRRFDERLGQPGGYRDQGYMFVATKQSHLDYLRDQPGAAEVARPQAGAHDHARRHCRHRSTASLRRHPRRQLLPDRRLRRSLQRDGWLHHMRVREGRNALALDRGHGDSTQWLGHHRGGDDARAGQHAGRGQRCRRMGARGRGAWRESICQSSRCAAC